MSQNLIVPTEKNLPLLKKKTNFLCQHYLGFSNGTHGPWIALHPDYVTRNVKLETEDPKSYLNFFKSVSKLRETDTLKRGGLATDIFNDTVFVLNR